LTRGAAGRAPATLLCSTSNQQQYFSLIVNQNQTQPAEQKSKSEPDTASRTKK